MTEKRPIRCSEREFRLAHRPTVTLANLFEPVPGPDHVASYRQPKRIAMVVISYFVGVPLLFWPAWIVLVVSDPDNSRLLELLLGVLCLAAVTAFNLIRHVRIRVDLQEWTVSYDRRRVFRHLIRPYSFDRVDCVVVERHGDPTIGFFWHVWIAFIDEEGISLGCGGRPEAMDLAQGIAIPVGVTVEEHDAPGVQDF